MELVKQLRVAEKDAAAGRELGMELESLRNLKAKNAVEIKDLKEIVDTQNVYEQMVEILSEKVTQLEDEIIELQHAIRDLEEAGEISQEMEEVQAELNKSLRLDVEKRDSTILNLEEAIKM
jgi:exonuclease VII small subunit